MLRDWEGWKMRWVRSISFERVWQEAGMSSTGSAELSVTVIGGSNYTSS